MRDIETRNNTLWSRWDFKRRAAVVIGLILVVIGYFRLAWFLMMEPGR